jgi:hypothetical protein
MAGVTAKSLMDAAEIVPAHTERDSKFQVSVVGYFEQTP